MDQKTFLADTDGTSAASGKSAQRLFVPKLLREAALNFDKRTPERDRAYEIIKKWAALESSGKMGRMKETNLEGEFFADVFSTALGYTIFSQNLPEWDLRAKYPIHGQTADGAIGKFRDEGADPPRVLIELKGPKSNIDRDRSQGRTPVQQCWDYLNLVPQCPWGLVCNYVGFRLYHRTKSPRAFEQFYLRDLVDINKFRDFYYLFERGGFLPSLLGQPPRCDELLSRSEIQRKEVGNKLYEFYHEQRVALINHLRRPPHGKSNDDAIYIAQKLLDRVIFIAFCQNRFLLPESTLERAWRDVPAFALATNPRWENFKHLFRSIDKGNKAANISAFNGGLFQTDPKVDDLQLDDQWTNFFREIGTYDFKDEVSLDVLGHLFEQSISDLEVLRVDPVTSLAPEKKKTAGKRKREGVYYTPEFITKFIVEETIGPCLRERFQALAEQLGIDPAVPAQDRQLKKWRDYELGRWDILSKLRVCDPACGSGAFLNQALEYLEDRYAEVVGEIAGFDDAKGDELEAQISNTILRQNLFGVDLSQEAVEITRLSLWIRTAERGKTLADLSHNIQWGNSVVSDRAVHPEAFDWKAAFPEVFAAGGFDVVVGNPPYVRQEWIAPYKAYWETAFQTFASVADIFVYFYERGLQILRADGRLAFITSGSWVRGNFGAPLRKFIAQNSAVDSMIDFGEYQPFVDAEMIRPTITILRKQKPGGEMRLFKWLTVGSPPENLSEVIASAPTMRTDHLGENTWELDPDDVLSLRQKLSHGFPTLAHFSAGNIFYGIKTGLSEVFCIDDTTRARLIADDPRSEEIIRPFVQGTNMRPWYVEDSGQFLLAIKSSSDYEWPWSKTGQDAEAKFRGTYPAIYAYLFQHAARLKNRQDQGRYWWELRTCSYWDKFDEPKIVWPDITNRPRFSMETAGRQFGDTGFMIPDRNYYLLGILASWTTWFFISKIAQPLRLRSDRWQYRLKTQYVEQVPIPDASKAERKPIAKLAEQCCRVGAERYELQSHVQHRLLTTFGEAGLAGPIGVLNEKASAWWEHSVSDLGAALKTSFKLSANPFKNPRTADEWEPYLAERRAAVERLTRELADAEAEINERVFKLFHLTPAEIRLLQKEVEH